MQDYRKLYDLSSKTVLITGATGFLGKLFSSSLAQYGAQVLIADRDEKTCHDLVATLKKNDLRAESFPVDLENEQEVREWGRLILAHHQVDVLINNAATKPTGFFEPFESYSLETLQKVMEVNFHAPIVTSQIFGSVMAQRGSGTIINMGSIYGVSAPDQRIYEGSWHEKLQTSLNLPVSYATSKAAVHQLTKYLSTLWGPRGVRVNTLSPGGVEEGQNAEFQKRYSERVPLGRMAFSEEIVGPMIFLCSDAASYLTGHNLLVDGGWSVW